MADVVVTADYPQLGTSTFITLVNVEQEAA